MTKEKRKNLEKSTQLNCVKNAKHWGDHAGSKPLFIIVNDGQRSFFRLLITILQFNIRLQCNFNLNIEAHFEICIILNSLSHIQFVTWYK